MILLVFIAVLKGIYFFKHQTCTFNSEQELEKHHKVLQLFGFRALGSDQNLPVKGIYSFKLHLFSSFQFEILSTVLLLIGVLQSALMANLLDVQKQTKADIVMVKTFEAAQEDAKNDPPEEAKISIGSGAAARAASEKAKIDHYLR